MSFYICKYIGFSSENTTEKIAISKLWYCFRFSMALKRETNLWWSTLPLGQGNGITDVR